jgi:hypothetical protein
MLFAARIEVPDANKVVRDHAASIDTTTRAGTRVLFFFAALAEFERDLISERRPAWHRLAPGVLRSDEPQIVEGEHVYYRHGTKK